MIPAHGKHRLAIQALLKDIPRVRVGMWSSVKLLFFPCSMPLEGATVVRGMKEQPDCQARILTTTDLTLPRDKKSEYSG